MNKQLSWRLTNSIQRARSGPVGTLVQVYQLVRVLRDFFIEELLTTTNWPSTLRKTF